MSKNALSYYSKKKLKIEKGEKGKEK